jgi:polyisoprenoid-binding protein YceI
LIITLTRILSAHISRVIISRTWPGNVRAGFATKTSIDRKDFGLTWNQLLEAGGVMVGERIDIA